MSNARTTTVFALLLAVGACSSGPPAPPALGYGEGPEEELTYVRADTTLITASMMGQSMEIEQRGEMTLAVAMSNTPEGADVRMSVVDLSGRITQPMGAPMTIDESAVDGDLVFSLDRRGRATVESLPNVELESSQMVSGSALAHGFFPRMPGSAMDGGASWVDTLSYEGEDAAGLRREESITTYTVEGPAVFDGMSVLRIGLTGTSTLSNEFEMGGMALSQSSEVEFEGHVLWDHQRGLMLEHVQRSTGAGQVNVPIAPVPLPIEIDSRQVTRLGGS